MSIALPEQLNYEMPMPLSGGAKQQMAVALPITGAGSYQLGSTFGINIPGCSDDTVFDPCNSFLRFNVYNSDGTGVLTWDHSVNSIIKKLDVLHAGNLVESIDNYGVFSSMMLDCQVDQSTRITGLNLTQGCGTTLAEPGLGESFPATGDRY